MLKRHANDKVSALRRDDGALTEALRGPLEHGALLAVRIGHSLDQVLVVLLRRLTFVKYNKMKSKTEW